MASSQYIIQLIARNDHLCILYMELSSIKPCIYKKQLITSFVNINKKLIDFTKLSYVEGWTSVFICNVNILFFICNVNIAYV